MALILGLVALACGSTDATDRGGVAADIASDPADAASAGSVAVIEVIEDALTVAASEQASPVPAVTGDEVGEGAVLTTDATGFARLDYADGSFSRLGPDTNVVLRRLASTVDRSEVAVGLDIGRTFHVVRELGGSGRFEVLTSVGVAAVRGTAFSVVCLESTTCTVVVVEGVVEVTQSDGRVVVVEAGEQVTLDADGGDDPVPAESDPWVDENVARGTGPSGDGDAPSVAAEPPPHASALWTVDDVVAATASLPESSAPWELTSCSDPDSLVRPADDGTEPRARCQWNRQEFGVLLTPMGVTAHVFWPQDPVSERDYGPCDQTVLSDVREAAGVPIDLQICVSNVGSSARSSVGTAVARVDGYVLVVQTFWAHTDDQNTVDDLDARESHYQALLDLISVGLERLAAARAT